MDRQMVGSINRYTGRRMEKQTDTQADGWRVKQIDKQIDIQTYL